MTGVFVATDEQRRTRLIWFSIEQSQDRVDGIELEFSAERAQFIVGDCGTGLWIIASSC